MRKINFAGMILITFLLFTALTSCSSDDDKTVGNIPTQLIKTWYIEGGNTITFNANGTGTFVEEVEESTDLSAKAAIFPKVSTRATQSLKFTYTYDETNKQIAISMSGINAIWTILSITDDELEVNDKDGGLIKLFSTKP